MFKNFFVGTRPPRLQFDAPSRRTFARIAAFTFIFALTACHTPPLPKVNLSEPGWKIFQGQAVWKANHDAPEISGEILLAQKSDGQNFVQFTKTPFPFAIAQSTTNAWRLEIPMQNETFGAPGKTPSRIIWFQLAHAVAGQPLKKPWMWRGSENNWHLENSATGESLEGYFSK
jgi:hypothetical protein